MPELPDVEVVVKRIRGKLLNRCISSVTIFDRTLTSESIIRTVKGKKIEGISRRGKYILFLLNDRNTLIIHLRMTGELLIKKPDAELSKHTRLIIFLDGDRELRFVDPRRLGKLFFIENMDFQGIPGLRLMGPEPLSEDFTLQTFHTRLKKRGGRIKSILMDQHFIAGIGNIYGDEILFQSGIRPSRKAFDLSEEEIGRLYHTIRSVLKKAIEHDADLSEMKDWFIHGRREGLCIKCRKKLERVMIQGRYSYFCEICQS